MIAARLRQMADANPQAPALISGQTAMSHQELVQTGAAAARMLEQRGVRAGDFVMVSLPVSIEAAVIFVACAEMGAIFFPVNLDWRKTELAWLIGEAPPALVLVSEHDFDRWIGAGVDRHRIALASAVAVPVHEPPAKRSPCAPDALVAALVSSGSMGRPKIVLRQADRVVAIAAHTAAACSMGPGKLVLSSVPFHFSHGLSNNLTMPLLSGATLVMLGRFDPMGAAEAIERHSVEYLMASPAMFTVMVDANVPAAALQSLRVCLSSGAPIAATVADTWRRRYGTPIRQAYGSSETGLMAIQDEDSADPEYVGRPLAGTEIRILSDDLEQPAGATGEIAVRGPGNMVRYLGSTPIRQWNGFLRTGDLGRLDTEGRLYVAGRVLPWINTGGVKVDPAEVQRVIAAIAGVRECRVEAEPAPDGMDLVAAVIAPEPGTVLTRADVIRHCRQHLAEFKLPRVIRFVDALAADLTGKSPKPWSERL